MNLYLISYDIDDNETNFLASLKELGDNCNYVKNGWFLRSDLESDTIYKKLQPFFTKGNGHLLIAKVYTNKMSGWLSSNTISWLIQNNNDN